MEAYAAGALVAWTCWARAVARRALRQLEQTEAELIVRATRLILLFVRGNGEERESWFETYSFRKSAIVID